MSRNLVLALSAAALALSLPATGAERDSEYVIDLTDLVAHARVAPASGTWGVRLLKRAPGAPYRITVRDSGGERVRLLSPEEPLDVTDPRQPRCLSLQRAVRDLTEVTLEEEVRPHVRSVEVREIECSGKQALEWAKKITEPVIAQLVRPEATHMLIERLTPDQASALRRWEVAFGAPPKAEGSPAPAAAPPEDPSRPDGSR